jgi:hypothetical protein
VKTNFVNEMISQLPMALFGIFYKVMTDATSLSIYNDLNSPQNCEMPLLP